MDNEIQITVTDEQRSLPINGLTVADAVFVVQIVERLTKTGTLSGAELYPIGMIRERFVAVIKDATMPNLEGMTPVEHEEITE